MSLHTWSWRRLGSWFVCVYNHYAHTSSVPLCRSVFGEMGGFPAVLDLNHSCPHMCTANTNTYSFFSPQITPKLQDRDQFNVSLRLSLPSSPSLRPPLPLCLQPIYFSMGVIEYTHLCTRTQEMRDAWASACTDTHKHSHTHTHISCWVVACLRF